MVKPNTGSSNKFVSVRLTIVVSVVCTACLVLADVPDRKSIEDNPVNSTWLKASAQSWIGKQLVFLEILKF